MNQIVKARWLVERLYECFNLKGWSVQIKNNDYFFTKDRYGMSALAYTHLGKNVIVLRRNYVKYASWRNIENSIRHEMAHAIQPRGTKPHGPEFKRCCLLTGAMPSAVSRIQAQDLARYIPPEYRWTALRIWS